MKARDYGIRNPTISQITVKNATHRLPDSVPQTLRQSWGKLDALHRKIELEVIVAVTEITRNDG